MPPVDWISIVSVLSLGLVLGLKHALDADHLAAISTLVSERRTLLGASLIGAIWGLGHTLSLFLAGILVMVLHVEIGARAAMALEFGVALMLIGLGANALRTLVRGGRLHWHTHAHGARLHAHPHIHATAAAPAHGHHGRVRPLLVGMVHGLAGSAALMLLVLTTIPSTGLGLAYIVAFGIGSIGGMAAMSALLSLPMHLTAERFAVANLAVRTLAGVCCLGLGLFMAYEIGIAGGFLV